MSCDELLEIRKRVVAGDTEHAISDRARLLETLDWCTGFMGWQAERINAMMPSELIVTTEKPPVRSLQEIGQRALEGVKAFYLNRHTERSGTIYVALEYGGRAVPSPYIED